MIKSRRRKKRNRRKKRKTHRKRGKGNRKKSTRSGGTKGLSDFWQGKLAEKKAAKRRRKLEQIRRKLEQIRALQEWIAGSRRRQERMIADGGGDTDEEGFSLDATTPPLMPLAPGWATGGPAYRQAGEVLRARRVAAGGPVHALDGLDQVDLLPPPAVPLEKKGKLRTTQNRELTMQGRRRTSKKGGHHLYKRLGVSKYASRKQIKKRYKKLKSQRKLTKKIKEAYKVLSNKRSRKRYNQGYRRRIQRGGFMGALAGPAMGALGSAIGGGGGGGSPLGGLAKTAMGALGGGGGGGSPLGGLAQTAMGAMDPTGGLASGLLGKAMAGGMPGGLPGGLGGALGGMLGAGGGGGGEGEFDLPDKFGDPLTKGIAFEGDPGPSSPPDLPTIQVSPDEKYTDGIKLPKTNIPQKLDPPEEYSDATKQSFRKWHNLINNDMQRLFNRGSLEKIDDEE